MTITSTSQALGSWSVKLAPGTPQDIINRLRYLGHISISVGRPDVRISGDSLLTSARYTGVLRRITSADDGWALSGAGMAYWIGDENKKGPIVLDQLLFTSATFGDVVNRVLASSVSVKAGTIYPVTGGYTGYHQFVTIREILDFVCSTMTSDTTDPVEWRVNGDGTVDAGTASQLYVHTTPTAAIVRSDFGGDLHLRALPGSASVDEDIEDYATEVILLGQGEGLGIASAQAKIPTAEIPYKDLFGNTVRIARTVSQSSTDAANSLVQAQIALNQYANPRDAVTLTTDQFDIEGDVRVGDSVWVHDPAAGLVDESPSATEIVFRGQRINPVKLRVSELTWPVEAGMSVAYRAPDGEWIDLTDYVIFETGSTQVTVGGYDRSLTNPTGRQEALGSRAAPNTSIPATPQFLTSQFTQAVYQSAGSGVSKAQIQLRWLRPNNTDGTPILDGDHYEIRYRTSDGILYRRPADSGDTVPVVPGTGLFPGSGTYPGTTTTGGSAAVIPPGFPSTWSQAASLQWNQMSTWAQPIEYIAGPWLIAYASFDTTQLLIQELTPGVPYQFEIRAVDNGVPPNNSAWSDPVEVIMAGDTIPPPTPAPPEIASSLIAIQVTHLLGAASGGTFNLPADMHHFEVHGAYEPTFTCSPATLLGKIAANNGMIVSQTPVVATIQVQTTVDLYVKVIAVDESGNKSNPSAAVQSTALLIDNEHISDLSVSKVTAGSITSNWIQTASLSTAPAGGARAGLDAFGLFAYNAVNARCWEVRDDTGDMIAYAPTGLPSMRIQAATGNVYLYGADGTTPTMKLTASSGLLELIGQLTAGAGVGLGATAILAPDTSSAAGGVARPGLVMYHDTTAAHSVLYGRPNTGDHGGSAFWLANRTNPTTYNGAAITGNADQLVLTFIDNKSIIGDTPVRTGGSLTLTPATANPAGVSLASYDLTGTANAFLVLEPVGAQLDGGGQQLIVGTTASNFAIFTSSGSSLTSNGVVKSFVIDHPQDDPADPRRWLVHACTESPTAGVEYTGTAVVEDELAVVALPDYFEALTEPEGRAVFLQPELVTVESPRPARQQGVDPDTGHARMGALTGESVRRPLVFQAVPSQIQGGRFHIVAPGAPDGARVHWQVKATRKGAGFDTEPARADVVARGDGPYRYLTPRPKIAKDAA